MNHLGILAGTFGALIALWGGKHFDWATFEYFSLLKRWLRNSFAPPPAAGENIHILGHISSSLRAGISLDSALEMAAQDLGENPAFRQKILKILEGKPDKDFLSSLLFSALHSGIPILGALHTLEYALRARQRLTLKAQSMSAQCRAQAEVLAWIPWILAASIAVIDLDWLKSAAQHPIAWLLWAMAIALTGAGRCWLSHLLNKCLSPQSSIERMEEESIPELTLRILCEISQGKDIETSTEKALSTMENDYLSRSFASLSCQTAARLSRLKSILSHCARTGSPVKEELLCFLQDLQAETESRWEGRVQRLPIALLSPLFLCFFPSGLLVLAGLLGPMLLESL